MHAANQTFVLLYHYDQNNTRGYINLPDIVFLLMHTCRSDVYRRGRSLGSSLNNGHEPQGGLAFYRSLYAR